MTAMRPALLLEHDFGGFDYGGYGVADLEFHFVGAAAGDHAFDQVIPYSHDYMGDDLAELELLDFTAKTISGGESHNKASLWRTRDEVQPNLGGAAGRGGRNA